ncbi:MAG: sulfatase [Gemmatimonadetes bacterium]|nr:sulfatase [Gemmatimonadota bacterium]
MNGRDTPGPRDLLLLAAGCGLVAGLLESTSQFIRHACCDGMLPLGWFTLWMPAVANAAFFLLAGAVLVLLAAVRPGLVTLPRALLVFLFLTAAAALRVLDATLSVYTVDLLALGCAVQGSRALGARPDRVRRWLPTVTLLAGAVTALLALGVSGGYWLRERRALAALPAARPGAPNVLLLVLDTARRLNVSAYGYTRPTTPGLAALAARGARFDNAISTAPWTLPGHAGIFTGRWAHELSASWTIPLDDSTPTLAEALSARGYRTAGVVANVSYAGRSVGLGRGFAHFEDVPVSLTQMARSAAWTSWLTSRRWVKPLLAPYYKGYHRKTAAEVNAALLAWLDRAPGRPYFAFLNYFDAHDPYLPAAPFDTAFGTPPYPPPRPSRHGGDHPDDRPREERAYDQALATLDREISRLLDSLAARGELERTLVIVTGDHGEEFGEHGLYGHGHTLNQQALNVGAILALPEQIPAGVVVGDRVSLRDLPATILDLAAPGGANPFPGASLARFWLKGSATPDTLYVQTRLARNRPTWDATSLGDLQGVVVGDLHLIRQADGGIALYDLATDSLETRNLAPLPAWSTQRAALTEQLDRVMGPPVRRAP